VCAELGGQEERAISTGDTAAQIPWHLSTPSMTQYGLTYNGVTTIKTVDGGSLRALDFTATKVTLVRHGHLLAPGGTKLQYVNGGANQTVTLTGVHLLTTELKAKLLGLIPVDFTPDSPPPLLVGVTVRSRCCSRTSRRTTRSSTRSRSSSPASTATGTDRPSAGRTTRDTAASLKPVGRPDNEVRAAHCLLSKQPSFETACFRRGLISPRRRAGRR